MAQKVKRYRVAPTTRATSFPVDMLRYDRCWPRSEADAGRLRSSIENPLDVEPVELRGLEAPTVGRWMSFGWRVEYWDGAWVPLSSETPAMAVLRKMEMP